MWKVTINTTIVNPPGLQSKEIITEYRPCGRQLVCINKLWPLGNSVGLIVVKSHGHTYWLASHITVLPRPTYQRCSLQRPFRGIKFPGRSHLEGGFPLTYLSGYPVRTWLQKQIDCQ